MGEHPAEDANSVKLYNLIYAKARKYLDKSDPAMADSLSDFKKVLEMNLRR